MIRGIKFNNENCFETAKQGNLMSILTTNTIVICQDTGVAHFLAEEITDICAGKHETEGHDYYAEDTDELKCRPGIVYLPTHELLIDGEQKIIFTVEASYVFLAKSAKDIWFADRTKDNKVSLYPLTIYIGYDKEWEKGIENIYTFIVSGRYGNYRYAHINYAKIGNDVKCLTEDIGPWTCYCKKHNAHYICYTATGRAACNKAIKALKNKTGEITHPRDWSIYKV